MKRAGPNERPLSGRSPIGTKYLSRTARRTATQSARERERTKWTANPKKHPHFKWTANSTYEVNGHELLGWTATNSWGERQRTFGVNGHELLGWTAKQPWTANLSWRTTN